MMSPALMFCFAMRPRPFFSEMHSTLDILLYYLGVGYQLLPAEHPLYTPGRCGAIVAAGAELGFIGEVRPEVLERTQIAMPCAAFEIDLEDQVAARLCHQTEALLAFAQRLLGPLAFGDIHVYAGEAQRRADGVP